MRPSDRRALPSLSFYNSITSTTSHRAVRHSRPRRPADWYLPAFHSLIILTKILRFAQDDSGRRGSPIPIPVPTSIPTPAPAAPSGALDLAAPLTGIYWHSAHLLFLPRSFALWRPCRGSPSQPKLALNLPIKGPSDCRLTDPG